MSLARTVLVTGAGGVGKTTVAAALGVASADAGMETLVLTVDPAKRLADALGLDTLHNDPTPVKREGLSAAMLDVSASWDAIIDRHAPPDVAARLHDNPMFRTLADRFPAAQSYAAGEQMVEYLEEGGWDQVIIDTPPSAGGIDFFQAPRLMSELVGSRLLKLLTGAGIPGRRTIYRVTARPALKFVDSILGSQLLEDVADFLFDLRATYDGLTHRAGIIERHLKRATTLVVTTADPTPIREARRFFEELPAVAGPPAAVVFNRTLPHEWTAAARMKAPDGRLAESIRTELRENLLRWAGETRRQDDAQREFTKRYNTTLAEIPWLAEPPTTLDTLAELMELAEGLPLERMGLA
jgi:arsenite-transporting ATPase